MADQLPTNGDTRLMEVPSTQVCPKCGKVHTRCKAHKHGRDAEGKMIPCNRWPVPNGNGNCHTHNGRAGAGPANSQYKTGQHSRFRAYLPKKLQSDYDAIRNDPELTSVLDQLTINELRQKELMKLLALPAPPWAEAVKQCEQVVRRLAQQRKDGREIDNADLQADNLLDLLRDGLNKSKMQRQVWKELLERSDHKARLATTEHRRLLELGSVMTAAEAGVFVDCFITAAEEIVKPKDEEAFKQLLRRTADLMPQTRRESPKVVHALEDGK